MLSSPSMFNAPSETRESKTNAEYLQPTLNHGLRIWWAYYWPTTIIAGLLAFCAAFWFRVLYQRAAISAYALRDALLVIPYATTAVVGILIFRYLLGKRFRRFRLALLPSAVNADTAPLRPVWRRTLRVWWTFTWRSTIYAIVLSFLVNISLGIFLGMLQETNRVLAVTIPLVEGLVIGGAVGLFVIYSNILDEQFGDFRVVLLPREPQPQSVAATGAPPQIQPTA